MKCVLQRVREASVHVDGIVVGSVGLGWLALVGAAVGDSEADAMWLADRILGLRAFADEHGKMNLALHQVGGALLVVSQFTLLANLGKGRRPSFELAMEPAAARVLYDQLLSVLTESGLAVATGVFGAHMDVQLKNDGPVTFILDSRQR